MNLHTIERRGSLKETYLRVNNLLVSKQIPGSEYFYTVCDRRIRYWDKNKGAFTLREYFQDIGLDFKLVSSGDFVDGSDEEYLTYICFVIEMLHTLIFDYFKELNQNLYNESMINFFDSMIRTIKERLELSNYTFKANLIDDVPEVTITKRNLEVDSVIESLTDESIQLLLLQYLDFRNIDNLEFKKETLFHLYKYVEKHPELRETRVVLKSCKTREIDLIKGFGTICDNYDVRHFPKLLVAKQTYHQLNDKDTKELCDIAFYFFVEAVRISNISKLNDSLEDYNDKYGIENRKKNIKEAK